MKTFTLDQIRTVANKKQIIAAVKTAFIAHAKGESFGPQPTQCLFHSDKGDFIGDCHIKSAQSSTSPLFVIKIASGFYHNPENGLPVNSGLVLLLSSETGHPVALLRDDGILTIMRTAAAGALAASLVETDSDDSLGIIGTGVQAEQQALWICKHLGLSRVLVHGRSQYNAEKIIRNLSAHNISGVFVDSAWTLCSTCRIVVTTTPATAPILVSENISNSTHIIAVGADSPGKNEIDPEIFARAKLVITDHHQQCLDHGDFGAAYRAGTIKENADISLGTFLASNRKIASSQNAITVVDLTGLGCQDLAIASLIYHQMQTASIPSTSGNEQIKDLSLF